MIIKCENNCRSDFQDKLYGPGKRVFNAGGATGSGARRYDCTVCGASQTKGGEGNHPKGKKALAAKAA